MLGRVFREMKMRFGRGLRVIQTREMNIEKGFREMKSKEMKIRRGLREMKTREMRIGRGVKEVKKPLKTEYKLKMLALGCLAGVGGYFLLPEEIKERLVSEVTEIEEEIGKDVMVVEKSIKKAIQSIDLFIICFISLHVVLFVCRLFKD